MIFFFYANLNPANRLLCRFSRSCLLSDRFQEYNASPWKNRFIRVYNQEESTWGGDRLCVELINEIFRKKGDAKPVSKPLSLDYILVLRKPNDHTTIVSTHRAFDTHFKGEKFTVAGELEALSDHYPQKAEIVL